MRADSRRTDSESGAAERVFLSLGSNLGDREANLRRAVALLSEHGVAVVQRSAVYETAPVGRTDQPPFCNMVVEARTSLAPRALLERLQAIERTLGRVRAQRWGPRTIDIDILLYGDRAVAESDLQIPHPRMRDRAFVLVPLAAIAPDLELPDGTRIAELLPRVGDQGVRELSE
ncbi:MAG: 2-amino-4-hydroxy-6-hydroxymethyldihydropteridine diphosphokinase [Armatimonadota bacterium]|nr:2-amino-4-hydroxy-6-hydroxymethyldihydropteridine diphosphokinase [Armatimonadota bacterium]MDR5697334.1 2-amino-4-hydroxy-6-hydroxymethyldihydropteridine diphosphokinase [Armatimonadota bacterium]